MGIKMKTPEARAGATGAVFKAGNFAKSTTLAQFEATQDRHGRVCKALGYALALDNPEGWCSLSYVAHTRLTEAERVMLAFQSMRILSPRWRQRVFEAAQWGLHHEA